MGKFLGILAFLSLPSLALAQPEPDGEQQQPPPAPGPAPAPAPRPAPAPPPAAALPAETAPAVVDQGPPNGWQLQARVPTGTGLENLVTPGFSIGKRSGDVVFAGEVGISGAKYAQDMMSGASASTSLYVLHLMPMIYDDLWKSPDGRARFNFVLGAGYGRGEVTTTSIDQMGMKTETTSYVSYLPLLAGVGGDYYLGRNLAIGVEIGAWVPIVLGVSSGGKDQKVTGNAEALRGLVRFTFVAGN